MKYLHLSLFTFGASANWKIKATTILKPNNTTLLIRPLFALGGEVDGLSFPHQAEHKLDDAEQKQNVAPDITGVKIPVMIPIVLCCVVVNYYRRRLQLYSEEVYSKSSYFAITLTKQVVNETYFAEEWDVLLLLMNERLDNDNNNTRRLCRAHKLYDQDQCRDAAASTLRGGTYYRARGKTRSLVQGRGRPALQTYPNLLCQDYTPL
jgi:hypothetical protein